jgi:hypothetical protein
MLQITTATGDSYNITDKGEIIRLDMPGFKPSAQWLLQGIEPVTGGASRFIPRVALTRETIAALGDLRYKNGNPRWTMRDLDHGTTRTWGNTKYHGIKSIVVLPDDYKGPGSSSD